MGTPRILFAAVAVLLTIVSGCSSGGSDDPTGPTSEERHVVGIDKLGGKTPPYIIPVVVDGCVVNLNSIVDRYRPIDENTEAILDMTASGGAVYRQKISVNGGKLVFEGAPLHGSGQVYFSFGDAKDFPDPNHLKFVDISARIDQYGGLTISW